MSSTLLTETFPDFDERLRFRIAPGQPVRFEVVGATAPSLAPGERPIGHDVAIGRRVKRRKAG